MGKETITYTCGHKETIQLYGKHTDRDRKVQFLEQKECTDCRAAKSKLNGSPKQKAWAEDVKQSIEEELYKALEMIQDMYPNQDDEAQAVKIGNRIIAMLNRTDASWWIDKRNHTALDFLHLATDNK